MIFDRDLHTLQTSGKDARAISKKDAEKNPIICNGWLFWVHKKCSNVPGRLVEDPNFRCKRCLVMHVKFMENPVFRSNLLMVNLV